MTNARDTLFLTFSLTLTLLLGETQVRLTILCGTNFQSVVLYIDFTQYESEY